MAFEYPTAAGVVCLIKAQGRWLLHYRGHERGQWNSADAAAKAVARHETGLRIWDSKRVDAPDDLLHWRPLGDSI